MASQPPKRRPNHATVVAYLALFVALGGTSYAALELPAGSVGSKQLHKDAVTSKKVKNRSLLAKDFAKDELPAGPRGAPGQTGGPGQTGATGLPAASMIMGFVPSSLTSEVGSEGDGYAPSGPSIGGSGSGEMPTPNHTVVLRDLVVKLSVDPAPGTRTFYIGDGTDTSPPTPAISCVIAPGARSCDSGAQIATVAPGRNLSFFIENGPTNPSNAQVAFSYRATTP